MHRHTSLALLGSLALLACSSEKDAPAGSGGADAGCASPMVVEDGACVDPLRRFEPEARVDTDNVVYYGDAALGLELPDPPKSGFRLVVPPRHLMPGDEVEACTSWAYPTIQNHFVYAARVYTSGALHHSNMYGMPISPDKGESPHPDCAPGQSDVAAQVPNMIQGNIMDVLFANSTQIDGGEQVVFPKGMAFKLTTEGREVTTSIHWLNVSGDEMTSEVVYDFFTAPESAITQEIVPFVFDNQAFEIPPSTKANIDTTCDLTDPTDANIVTIMPHTHKRARSFDVELLHEDGSKESIYHDGAFDTGSEITVFDEPIALAGFTRIHHRCVVENELPEKLVWGIGNNEMCTLFGYMYPPRAQQLGFVGGKPDAEGNLPPCIALDIGVHR